MEEQYNPNQQQESHPRNNGAGARMQEFAAMIEMILAKYAGGFAHPVPVKMLDEKGGEIEVMISPIQALVNLTVSVNDLECQLAELRLDSDEEEDEREYGRTKRRRRR